MAKVKTNLKAGPAPVPVITNVFRVRHRVRAGTPEAAGSSVETIASHVSDTNAHPDYLKKGGAVPSGQESAVLAMHASNQVAHAPVSIRRAETLKTKNQYDQAKSTDYVDMANNYFAGQPIRHVVTAYVLNQILKDYVDSAMFKNVVKRRMDIDGTMGPVGDGSQLIFIEDDADGFGYAALSTKTIGSSIKPVFLNNGTITASSGNVGNSKKPIFMESGTLKASDANEGSGINPVYLTGGTITKSTSTVGSAIKPVYLDNGVITASASTIGSGKKPIYLNSGTITESAETVGSGVKPVYLNSGEITASNSTVGSAVKPIFLSGGTITVSNGNVGSATQPVFLNNGTITASTGTVGTSNKPIFMEAGTLKASDATVGSGTNPVFLSGGAITKSTSTVGSGVKPIFMTGGTLTASGSTVGTSTKPVYLSSGTITESSATVGSGIKPVYLNNGEITASGETVGAATTPTYLNNGTITALPYTVVTASGSLAQTITGVKTFQSIPKISNAQTLPSADVDFVTVAYLNQHTRIPVGGIYTHSEEIALTGTGSVQALLGYGTWAVHAYIGNAAVMYRRVS